MFIIDMQGLPDLPTRSKSSHTPGERYWGSCIANTTRSYCEGSASSVPPADRAPGQSFELISIKSSRPRTGIRTIAPSLLKSSASSGRHTRQAECPAYTNLMASSEPYEAPMIKVFYFAPISSSPFPKFIGFTQ